jgi:hypothetical protein
MAAESLAFEHLAQDHSARRGAMLMMFMLIGVVSGAAVIVRRCVPLDALGFRLGDYVIWRLNMILPRPLQSLGQGMAAAMVPTLIRVAATTGRIHAEKRLAGVLCGSCGHSAG